MECLRIFSTMGIVKLPFGMLLALPLRNPNSLPEDFMNKRIRSRWLPVTPALLLGMALSGANLSAAQSQPPAQQQEPPAQPPNQSGQQAPDSQANAQPAQGQVFAGTIKKTGDKYVLQDASGTAYDVDRQDLVKKYEGQRVRINGTLDPDGKTIHVK
jgi:uncharacterized protein YdeI (BOF family)